ncbi:hypothetical protein ABZ348_11765 [Streptomyces sp. NPDC005963]|uniref:hypothetical protein n=1 Tax=Streptomyces sp. NPDC005963 TaxID=3156721 RepID=UPI003400087B
MNDRSMMTAETVGSAARFDPQLRIPHRPRLRRGLVVSAEADQVVVTGPPKKQLFRGRSATEMLPRLLDLLDGERTHGVLATELGMPEEVVFKALSLLWTCGVIEEGPPRDAPAEAVTDIDDRLADYLSRVGSATEVNPCWEQAAARLHHAHIELFGDPTLCALLRAELGGSMPVALGIGSAPTERATLVVWADAGGDRSAAGSERHVLADHCWDKGVPLLRLGVHGRRAALGPLVDPRSTPCLDCLTAVDEQGDDDRAPVDGDRHLAASLFARDVFSVVSRTTPSPLPMRWRLLDLETLSQRDTSSATRPGCRRCSVSQGPPVEQAAPATRFEASVAMPPKEFADIKAHQMHYKPSNLALQRVSRTWPVAPAIALPQPDHDRLGASGAPPQTAPGLDTLSLLLSVTAGIKADYPDKVARWTASGGNIGSVTAYAVVRDVPGIVPGIYGYVPAEHRLARLSSRADAIPGDRPLSIVLTGDFPKVARKYSAFALRIVLLDSGCAQATAREAAHVLGIGFALRPRWDDDSIAASLGINPDMEPITAVIDLGGAP